jgi:putative endonuclease
MPDSPQDVHKKVLGRKGEKLATDYLKKRGYKILKRNYKTPFGEADIIAQDCEEVVFVEVKTRRYDPRELDLAPPPGTAVHHHKQQHTRACARSYLAAHPTRKQPRMDVIEIWLSKDERPRLLRLHHIKAAY